jgi:hypothetical protein
VPVQKSSAMTDTYVCRGVEIDKDVPLTEVATQSLKYWSSHAPAPTWGNFIGSLEPYKNTILYKHIH